MILQMQIFNNINIRWTYADPSWARIAALVPVVVACAEAGDEVANNILLDSVEELALSVKAVIQRLGLAGEGMESNSHSLLLRSIFPFMHCIYIRINYLLRFILCPFDPLIIVYVHYNVTACMRGSYFSIHL